MAKRKSYGSLPEEHEKNAVSDAKVVATLTGDVRKALKENDCQSAFRRIRNAERYSARYDTELSHLDLATARKLDDRFKATDDALVDTIAVFAKKCLR